MMYIEANVFSGHGRQLSVLFTKQNAPLRSIFANIIHAVSIFYEDEIQHAEEFRVLIPKIHPPALGEPRLHLTAKHYC